MLICVTLFVTFDLVFEVFDGDESCLEIVWYLWREVAWGVDVIYTEINLDAWNIPHFVPAPDTCSLGALQESLADMDL